MARGAKRTPKRRRGRRGAKHKTNRDETSERNDDRDDDDGFDAFVFLFFFAAAAAAAIEARGRQKYTPPEKVNLFKKCAKQKHSQDVIELFKQVNISRKS